MFKKAFQLFCTSLQLIVYFYIRFSNLSNLNFINSIK